MKTRFTAWIGLAGVAPSENAIAKRLQQYFTILTFAAIVWLAFQWHLELKQELTTYHAWLGNFIVWIYFIVETMVMTLVVDNRRRYLKGNWLNVVIVLLGAPLLLWEYGPIIAGLKAFRVILTIALFTPWVLLVIRFLTDSRLDTTVLSAFVILVIAGILVSSLDPAFNSIEDGIWWAWVTISTVGYGDIVPSTTVGRVFGGVLIFIGLGLFSIITANFAALFVQRNAKKNRYLQYKWEKTFGQLEKIQTRERDLLHEMQLMRKEIHQLQQSHEQLQFLVAKSKTNNIDSHISESNSQPKPRLDL
ncbi:MAG: hypothetical protein Tsb005_03810 [Gammaproteobacteria bacterium]